MTSTPSTPVRDEKTTIEVTTPTMSPSFGTVTYQRLGTAMAVAEDWNDRDGPRDIYVCQAPQAETFYCCNFPHGGTQHYTPVMTLRGETRTWEAEPYTG